MNWRIEKYKYPKEIVDFLGATFEIYEVRGRVGEGNGIRFSVRTNEGNHVIPHIHAVYGEYEISIAIETQEILAGNLPKKKFGFAQQWVREHKDRLMNDWKNIAISATSTMTKSRLDFQE